MDQAALNLEVRRSNNIPVAVTQETLNKVIARMHNIQDQNPEDNLVSISSTAIAADGTAEKFTSASVDFVAEGIEVGQWLNVSGFTTEGNNGVFKVTAVASGEVTVDGDLTTEAAGDTIVITCEEYRRDEMNTEYAKRRNIPADLLP